MPYWKLYYHIIWATKHRKPIILPRLEYQLFHWIQNKAEHYNARILSINGVEDHIHVVASVPPTITLSSFIGQLKGHSSYNANKNSDIEFTFAWQNEYSILSLSEKDLDPIIRYVSNQKHHHSRRTTLIGQLELCSPSRE